MIPLEHLIYVHCLDIQCLQASVQSQSFAGLTDLLDAHRRQRSGYAPIGEADKTVRDTARPQGLNVAVSL